MAKTSGSYPVDPDLVKALGAALTNAGIVTYDGPDGDRITGGPTSGRDAIAGDPVPDAGAVPDPDPDYRVGSLAGLRTAAANADRVFMLASDAVTLAVRLHAELVGLRDRAGITRDAAIGDRGELAAGVAYRDAIGAVIVAGESAELAAQVLDRARVARTCADIAVDRAEDAVGVAS